MYLLFSFYPKNARKPAASCSKNTSPLWLDIWSRTTKSLRIWKNKIERYYRYVHFNSKSSVKLSIVITKYVGTCIADTITLISSDVCSKTVAYIPICWKHIRMVAVCMQWISKRKIVRCYYRLVRTMEIMHTQYISACLHTIYYCFRSGLQSELLDIFVKLF